MGKNDPKHDIEGTINDLAAFYKKNISSTWKERHANGVPIPMYCSVYVKNGSPEVIATFRNFRYKPEYLVKKGKSVVQTVNGDFDSPPIGGFKD